MSEAEDLYRKLTLPTLIHRNVAKARRGELPGVIRRMESGWAVMFDQQNLRGYCLLLPDPVVGDLNALDAAGRAAYLRDMALLGDAVRKVTGAWRINYMILGNVEPALHAHVIPRFHDEPKELRRNGPWIYAERAEQVKFDAKRDGELMRQIGEALDQLQK